MRDSEHDPVAGETVNEDEAKRRQMEEMVSSYDSYMNEATRGRDRELRELTVELAHIKTGDSVLEVGCGTGTLSCAAKRRVGPSGRVVGIDVIPGMVEAARRKAAQLNEDISFQIGSIESIPFATGSFDDVLCSFMIFHMSEDTRAKGIREIHRVLKPAGRLLVIDLAPPPDGKAEGTSHASAHDLRALIPLLQASGLSQAELLPVQFEIQGTAGLAAVRASARKT